MKMTTTMKMMLPMTITMPIQEALGGQDSVVAKTIYRMGLLTQGHNSQHLNLIVTTAYTVGLSLVLEAK